MQPTTGNAVDPNGVNHPSHYNMHPSGIECIDLVRCLPFGLGNAVKYLWRSGLKQTEKQDLEKALWYIDDTLQNLCPCLEPDDDTAPQTVYAQQLRDQYHRFSLYFEASSRSDNDWLILQICISVTKDTRIPLENARFSLARMISDYKPT